MQKLLRMVVGILGIVAVVLAIAITFTIGWRPIIGPRVRPATNRKFEPTPARLARGRYLAENLAGCMDCHSPHDMKQPSWPIVTGMEGSGDVMSDSFNGLPGRVVAANLTSDPETGVANWSDDQLARAIREGVDRNGRALFPEMPYTHFREMSDEDLASVVVFLRSLPPVRRQLAPTKIDFPVNYLIRTVPEPLEKEVPPPDASTPERRGAYLVNLAGCSECHTPQKRGQPLQGMEFAGGFAFSGAWGQVASANITPDATGISYYDLDLFKQAVRSGSVRARALSPMMPFRAYAGLQDEDIAAMFAYLKTLKPIHHRVDNTEPPTLCPLCGQIHGLGDKN